MGAPGSIKPSHWLFDDVDRIRFVSLFGDLITLFVMRHCLGDVSKYLLWSTIQGILILPLIRSSAYTMCFTSLTPIPFFPGSLATIISLTDDISMSSQSLFTRKLLPWLKCYLSSTSTFCTQSLCHLVLVLLRILCFWLKSIS